MLHRENIVESLKNTLKQSQSKNAREICIEVLKNIDVTTLSEQEHAEIIQLMVFYDNDNIKKTINFEDKQLLRNLLDIGIPPYKDILLDIFENDIIFDKNSFLLLVMILHYDKENKVNLSIENGISQKNLFEHLSHCFMENKISFIVESLCKRGLDINAKFKNGENFINSCIKGVTTIDEEKKLLELFEYIENIGIKLNFESYVFYDHKNNLYETKSALFESMIGYNPNLVEYIMKKGIKYDIGISRNGKIKPILDWLDNSYINEIEVFNKFKDHKLLNNEIRDIELKIKVKKRKI